MIRFVGPGVALLGLALPDLHTHAELELIDNPFLEQSGRRGERQIAKMSQIRPGISWLLGSALLIILATFGGCASVQNTPRQEYVWEMGRICDSRSNTWYMDKVEPDGSYTIRGATNSVGGPNLPYFSCMNEQFKAQPFPDWAKARKGQAKAPTMAVGSTATRTSLDGSAQGSDCGDVEGASIPLDTGEPKYQGYFNSVRERIRSKWTYPREAAERSIQGEALIEFRIAEDGRLESVELQRSSGTILLDEAALAAVRQAEPFPPLPDGLATRSLTINGKFRYQIISERGASGAPEPR